MQTVHSSFSKKRIRFYSTQYTGTSSGCQILINSSVMAAVGVAPPSLKRAEGSSSGLAALFRCKHLIAHLTSPSHGGVIGTFDIVWEQDVFVPTRAWESLENWSSWNSAHLSILLFWLKRDQSVSSIVSLTFAFFSTAFRMRSKGLLMFLQAPAVFFMLSVFTSFHDPVVSFALSDSSSADLLLPTMNLEIVLTLMN